MWTPIPPDPIFEVYGQYIADSRPEKVNAAIGVLLQNQRPYIMPSVEKAVEQVQKKTYSYLPIRGSNTFLEWVQQYYLPDADHSRIAAQQTAGGTQAFWAMGQLGAKGSFGPYLIPTPTWENHFTLLGDQKTVAFSHITDAGDINIEAYKKALLGAPAGAVLVLQATGAHNPTGKNLSAQQREIIIQIANERGIWVYLDGAYIGLAQGISYDKQWIQEVWNATERCMLGVSFSKTATLYGHRLGGLFVKTQSASAASALETHMQAAIRASISTPPRFGSDVMEALTQGFLGEWEADVTEAQVRLMQNRNEAKAVFLKHGKNTWAKALDGKGLFALLPFGKEDVRQLAIEEGIYIAQNGRINIAGMNVNVAKKMADLFL